MLLTLNSLLNPQRSLLQETFRTSCLLKSFPTQPRPCCRDSLSLKSQTDGFSTPSSALAAPAFAARNPLGAGTPARLLPAVPRAPSAPCRAPAAPRGCHRWGLPLRGPSQPLASQNIYPEGTECIAPRRGRQMFCKQFEGFRIPGMQELCGF